MTRTFAATWVVLLAAGGLFAGVVALLVPAFADEADSLEENLDGGIAEIEDLAPLRSA